VKFINELRGVLDPTQQSLLYALSYQDELINRTYSNLVKEIGMIDHETIGKLPFQSRVSALSLCWTLVESFETLRQLIDLSEFQKVKSLEILMPHLKTCNELRRKKAHLPQLLGNIEKVGQVYPLMGMLKWTNYSHGDNYAKILLISCDPFPKPPNGEARPIKPIDMTKSSFPAPPGDSNICLIAFAEDISLSAAYGAYSEFAEEVDKIAETSIAPKKRTLEKAKLETNEAYSSHISWVVRADKNHK
jgi:hypothetical protein